MGGQLVKHTSGPGQARLGPRSDGHSRGLVNQMSDLQALCQHMTVVLTDRYTIQSMIALWPALTDHWSTDG